MANRSDRDSTLPRKYKRLISLMGLDAHRSGEMRRLFIGACAVEQAIVKKRLTQKSDGFDDQGTTLTTQAAEVEKLTLTTERDKETGTPV